MIKTITLDDQNYDQILEHARKAIRKYAPYWTDENAHDPGITMIELFAWLNDMLQFYMDQTTESVEMQFLKLLGVSSDYGQPARMVVQCMSGESELHLPYKSKLSNGRYTFETENPIALESTKIKDLLVSGNEETRSVYQSIYNGLSIYPFGTECLPGSHFTICYDMALPNYKAHQLYFRIFEDYEVKRSSIVAKTAFFPLAQLQWLGSEDGTEWHELEVLKDETYGFLQSGLVTIQQPIESEGEKAIRFIRVVVLNSEYEVAPRIIDVFNRVIEVVQTNSECYYTEHQETFEGNILYFDSNGLPNQTLEIPFADVFYKTLGLEVYEKLEDGAFAWHQWHLVENLLIAEEACPCFVMAPSGQGINFGDGVHGKIPPKGIQNIRLVHLERSYFDEGNISLDYLTHEPTHTKWRCLTSASGGIKRPTLEVLKTRMQELLGEQHVCVTARDYEEKVLETPGLMLRKAKCLPLFKPGLFDYPNQLAENAVSILVIPYGEHRVNKLNRAYLANLRHQMEKHRLITTEVHLLDPIYYEIQVYCEISSPYPEQEVLAEAVAVLKNQDHFDFGQAVSKSVFYKSLSESKLIGNIHNISLRCDKPLTKNRLGDLAIPVNGLGIIGDIEVVMIHE